MFICVVVITPVETGLSVKQQDRGKVYSENSTGKFFWMMKRDSLNIDF